MEPKRIFIDSNVFLNVLLKEGKDFETSFELLKSIEKGRYTGITTLVNLMEILFILRKISKNDKKNIDTVESLFQIPNLNVMIPNEFNITEAYLLQRDFGLNPNDAIFVSIAKSNSDVIITRDLELKNSSSKIIKCLRPEELEK